MKCSKCNTKMVRDDSFAYSSNPLQYDYTCPKCGERRIGTAEADYDVEESVNEDLEEASKEWLRPQLDKSYANYGEAMMMELTHFDGYAMLDAIEFGVKWQMAQMMANAIDATICLPYENDDGGYTHLIDVSRPLPVGNNKIAIIFKED